MTRVLATTTLLVTLLTALAGACGGSTSAPAAGGLLGACYGNDSCNAGLTCASRICVVVDGSAGSESSTSSSGAGSSASSGTGSSSSASSGSSSSSGSASSSSGTSGVLDAALDTGPMTVSYRQAVIADGPAGYWRLDDSGGVAADSSGNGLNGTYQGGVTKLVPGALLTDTDPAVTLDGSSGYVTTGFVQNVTAYSVEAWFKTTAAGSSFYTGPIFQDRGSGNGLSLTLAMSGSAVSSPCTAGHVMFVFDTAVYEGGVCTGSMYNDGSWHYVVATFSASAGTSIQCGTSAWPTWATWTSSNCPEFQLYVDGAPAPGLVASGGQLPFSAPLMGSGTAIAGYEQPWESFWPGSLDEIAVYNTVLPAARVAAHYQAAGY